MRVDDLIDAIGKIDLKYVEEAEIEELLQKKERNRKPFRVWMSLAASVAVMILLGSVVRLYYDSGSKSSDSAVCEESVEMAMDVAGKAEQAENAETSMEVAEDNGAGGENVVWNDWDGMILAASEIVENGFWNGTGITVSRLSETVDTDSFEATILGKQNVFMFCHMKGDGTVSYLALLKKNDAQYQLTGENVTEEEFVENVKMFLQQ